MGCLQLEREGGNRSNGPSAEFHTSHTHGRGFIIIRWFTADDVEGVGITTKFHHLPAQSRAPANLTFVATSGCSNVGRHSRENVYTATTTHNPPLLTSTYLPLRSPPGRESDLIRGFWRNPAAAEDKVAKELIAHYFSWNCAGRVVVVVLMSWSVYQWQFDVQKYSKTMCP